MAESVDDNISEWENETSQSKVLELLTNYTEYFIRRLRQPCETITQACGIGHQDMQLSDVVKIGKRLNMEGILQVFDKHLVCSTGMDFSKPTCFSLIPGCGHFLYAVGEYIASLTRAVPSARFVNPGACDIEESVVRWVLEIVGYPPTANGVHVSGTSMGAVVTFATARDTMLTSPQQYNRAVVYVTNHTHESHRRALRVVGLGGCVLRVVPDASHRMEPERLAEMITEDKKTGLIPFLVIGSLGTGGVGSVDPIDAISDLTEANNLWLHVDAAYGGFLLLDDKMKKKFKVHRSDSIAMDYHKGMSAPYGTGILLVRDGKLLSAAMARDSGSMIPPPGATELYSGATELYSGATELYSPLDLSFEYTRPFRAFPIWFFLKIVGPEAVKYQMSEKLQLAASAYRSLKDMTNVAVFMEPDLTLVAFRFSHPDKAIINTTTQKWLDLLLKDGHIVVTSTTASDGFLYIRLCILSFRSDRRAVDIALSSIRRTLEALMRTVVKQGLVSNFRA